MAFEFSGEIASLELRLYPTLQPDRADTTADLQRYLGIMSLQNIRHKAAALHQLPPKVEMILLEKKDYARFLFFCSLAYLEMLSLQGEGGFFAV